MEKKKESVTSFFFYQIIDLHYTYICIACTLVVSTYPFYYTVSLDSECEAKYVYVCHQDCNLGIQLLYCSLAQPAVAPSFTTACLAQIYYLTKTRLYQAPNLNIAYKVNKSKRIIKENICLMIMTYDLGTKPDKKYNKNG